MKIPRKILAVLGLSTLLPLIPLKAEGRNESIRVGHTITDSRNTVGTLMATAIGKENYLLEVGAEAGLNTYGAKIQFSVSPRIHGYFIGPGIGLYGGGEKDTIPIVRILQNPEKVYTPYLLAKLEFPKIKDSFNIYVEASRNLIIPSQESKIQIPQNKLELGLRFYFY